MSVLAKLFKKLKKTDKIEQKENECWYNNIHEKENDCKFDCEAADVGAQLSSEFSSAKSISQQQTH